MRLSDKKVVLVDDLSYYQLLPRQPAKDSDKLVLDENGNVKCHYASGNESVGDYDGCSASEYFPEYCDGAYRQWAGPTSLLPVTMESLVIVRILTIK